MNRAGLPPNDRSAEQQRFLSLFLRSEKEVFRYVAALVPNMVDAEDIVQQTALSLWEKFDAYDPAQPFTPWACRFALNKARQWVERRQRWQALLKGGLAEEVEQPRRVAPGTGVPIAPPGRLSRKPAARTTIACGGLLLPSHRG